MVHYYSEIFFFFIIIRPIENAGLFRGNYPPDVIEDSDLKTDELLRKYKYPCETHFVLTDDNYILQVHRIPKPGGKPILMQHGLSDSSATYILMGPSNSLGYNFYNKGYDVWIGNARGNRYSRNHTTLNPDVDLSFWNFSWHEIGIFDLPAMIDYILKATGHEKLFYVGHSQGTTALFVMCSMRPEYNSKIILAHALAPVAYMKHVKGPLVPYALRLAKVPIILTMVDFFPNNRLIRDLCSSGKNQENICLNVYFLIVGYNKQQLNRTKFITIMGHIPAGISIKQLLHYFQLIESDKFRQYDHGISENIRIYNQTTPPDYELEKITAPIVLHYSLNDYLSEKVDVMRLIRRLPNKFAINEIKLPKWNHMDFLYGIDARKLLYDYMEELNNKIMNYEPSNDVEFDTIK